MIFRHLRIQHRHQKEDQAYQSRIRNKLLCRECGKAFSDAHGVNRHMRCHSTETKRFCLVSSAVERYINTNSYSTKKLQWNKVEAIMRCSKALF
ncbi:hypothetical protein X801_05340 [Opisthorchis viverrini]|uniref:C2H2-type domain-containing protein n=1 Tax=Opisthorchis viverrini TaxID=6198 RepID=A0A1S8WWJ1_OPIVI|nr:hypothetical protein X801_05340 [Opisthorchis viverrini]